MDRSRSRSFQKWAKDRTGPDFQVLIDSKLTRAGFLFLFFFSGENRINDSSTIRSPAIHRSNCLISSSIECVDKFSNCSVIFILFYFNCNFFFFFGIHVFEVKTHF